MSNQQDQFGGIEQQAFEVLEREFQEVLNDLAADQSLDRFRQEFEKFHRALKVSQENEKRLLAKCREYTSDIGAHTANLQGALKMTQEDNTTIAHLKSELEKTYKILELSKDREEKSKQKIENLDLEIKNLNQLIERSSAANSGQTTTVADLLTAKEELTKGNRLLEEQIKDAKSQLEFLEKSIAIAEDAKLKNQEAYQNLQNEKQDQEQKMNVHDEKKKSLQKQQEDYKNNNDQVKQKIKTLTNNKVKLTKEIDENKKVANLQDQEIKEFKSKIMKLEVQIEEIKSRKGTLEKELEEREINLEVIKQKIDQDEKIIKYELKFIQEKMAKKRQLLSEIENLDTIKVEAEIIKNLTEQGINYLESEIKEDKKLASEGRSILEELRRNRDILQKEIDRADNNNKKQEEELIQKEKIVKEKKNELSGMNKEMDKFNYHIAQLKKEKEKYAVQAAAANAKYFHALEEIKLKDNLISEFQKKNIETQAKLKQQQNLYETVRQERNLYSKNLTETLEDLEEIKRKQKIVNHQISQLKEEIDSKQKKLLQEHINHKKKDDISKEHTAQSQKYKKEINEKEQKIKAFQQDIAKLRFMIQESEQQRQKLHEEYELVVAERDILGTQLIRRNAEAALLYEKIKINQSTLKKGEIQYQERLGDIIVWKSKIADLINQIKEFKAQANSIDDMKREIHNLSKELIEEKLKVKALSEEIQNPMNVHRWRKLEATDSETYELMTKIQSLQKRLILKTEDVIVKEKVVLNKETELKKLKQEMKRQPGAEEEKLIPVYQESLKEKTKQMRAMNGELTMYQSHLAEYKLEIDRLTKDLQDSKKKFYEQKKREQQQYEAQQTQQKAMAIQINLPDKRFTGGGFNLAIYN
ncbi:flagellar associated protein (macronuclear) [Tetrahymena thermophila SB210]|uniref:Flagellar associated protein n=1 Tax=Tetrahymena thermophila (strain SB210) TaxID=312017 RepID=Q22M20_TETTS|nr:flagellar associated protein [Tetrahymena thermophila SB210]EAR86580.1 flagellar associated protein [Tetrahymena thermophila SB210]|eukprot:XP_977200.1 flagellar associated protein [Tetrahymena thermophila SB210]